MTSIFATIIKSESNQIPPGAFQRRGARKRDGWHFDYDEARCAMSVAGGKRAVAVTAAAPNLKHRT
jgi:phage baseplate assembly protein gpV